MYVRQGGEGQGSTPPLEEAKFPSRCKCYSPTHPASMSTAAIRIGRLLIYLNFGRPFSPPMLTHVLGLAQNRDHIEESDNAKKKMRCEIPDTRVTSTSSKGLLCALFIGMNEIIYTLLISEKEVASSTIYRAIFLWPTSDDFSWALHGPNLF